MPYINTFHRSFWIEVGIAAAVFVIVGTIMTAALVAGHRRRRRGRKPSHRSEWTLLEGSYTVFLIGVASFLVWLSLTGNATEHTTHGPPQVVVRVTGFQWCWRFDYLGQHASDEGTCSGGHDLPTLVLPTHRRIELQVISADVVHEFWVPHLKYKIQAFPHHINFMRFHLEQKGEWTGRCAEFCGLYHSYMDFYFRVVSPTTYHHWLAAHHTSPISSAA